MASAFSAAASGLRVRSMLRLWIQKCPLHMRSRPKRRQLPDRVGCTLYCEGAHPQVASGTWRTLCAGFPGGLPPPCLRMPRCAFCFCPFESRVCPSRCLQLSADRNMLPPVAISSLRIGSLLAHG